ncbi:AEC family transporter [Schaalia sp. ZJ405]|uniref:AEC family transporter n=1 Tax=Schaalia sp. ZJ405 TaxID=2709403 RepID=UPI0013EBFEDD|nr:AEC family transporter [Schaalia sp. ZJ405]QPK80564.1 AEC family transporter [Schaalia sp. ZJ405]
MADIVSSICAIGLVIVVGWAVRRLTVIDEDGARALSSLSYWVASPAMLFRAVATSDIGAVLGPPLWVAAASGVGTAVVFVLVGILGLRLRGGNLTLGAMSASLNNAAYIGIPIAVYVLGEASAVVPIMVFQLGFFTPMFFVLADLAGSDRAPSVRHVVSTVVTNPMVLAAGAGVICASFRVPLPRIVDVSTTILGNAAPPMILLAFGASLVGRRFALRSSLGGAIAVATVCKLIIQPCIAFGVGMLLGLHGPALMAVTMMAGLPTAQNAFIAATRARTGEEITQGVVLATTVFSLPLTIVIAWIFHAFLKV